MKEEKENLNKEIKKLNRIKKQLEAIRNNQQ